MNITLTNSLNSDACLKGILAWLSLTQGKKSSEIAEQLLRQLHLLRQTALPSGQRGMLLDLLFAKAEYATRRQIRHLRDITLPISHKARQRVRTLTSCLELLAQDYLIQLAKIFDPDGAGETRPPQIDLAHAMQASSLHIHLNQLIASPPPPGLWQALHSNYRTALRLGIERLPLPDSTSNIHRIYLDTLLTGIAQPASFTSRELELIHRYIHSRKESLPLRLSPPSEQEGVFWIESDKDFPAHALARRPPADAHGHLYLCCATLAEETATIAEQLERGHAVEGLHIPEPLPISTAASIFRRLTRLWGHPAKRRFHRRRQSYRAKLFTGLNKLYQLYNQPDQPDENSEWMVTNESPEGYALMHVNGEMGRLTVGDVVALEADAHGQTPSGKHICIIRWALSENPEHLELGLQLLSRNAIATQLDSPTPPFNRKLTALLLPETPPLRPHQALIVATGEIPHTPTLLTAHLHPGDQAETTRKLHTTHIDEQTGNVDIFNLSPDP